MKTISTVGETYFQNIVPQPKPVGLEPDHPIPDDLPACTVFRVPPGKYQYSNKFWAKIEPDKPPVMTNCVTNPIDGDGAVVALRFDKVGDQIQPSYRCRSVKSWFHKIETKLERPVFQT